MAKTHDNPSRWRTTLHQWWPGLLVAGLWLFHLIANWTWLSKNVVMRSWDRIGALINSLYYYDTLSNITIQSLFKASIQDEIRPPLFAASMAAMQKLFGVSSDLAIMVNAVYLAVLLFASYGIGARLGGRRQGLLSVSLVAFTPLLFAMSRYSYFEFAVAAFAALSVYLLLASERFEKRSPTFLLGIALGLGTLTKRTFPIFVLGAAAVVFLQAGLPQKLWNRLKRVRHPRWRDLLLSLVGGFALSALWYFPNQDLAQTLAFGFWLFPMWGTIYAFTIYFVLQPPDATANFLSCGGLALSVASLWYLPRASFVQRALRAGWGVDDPRGRVVDWTDPATWTDYLQSFLYGFSPVLSLLLLLALGLLLIHLIRSRGRSPRHSWWNSDWWAIVACLGISYFILSTSIYKEHRAITPALPFLSIILAGALCRLPWRRLGTALASFAVVFGLVQFFAISYTETHWLAEQARFPRPILAQGGLFAEGPYLELPDSGLNDPGYHISPAVLRHVDQRRELEGWDSISLGIVANSSHVHIGMLAYEQLKSYPAIQVEDPVQAYPQESAYSKAFQYDYVLVLTYGSRGTSTREAVATILGERRPWFETGFELEQVHALPDESEVLLFGRRQRPERVYRTESLFDVAQYLRQTSANGNPIVVYPPDLLYGVLQHYWGPADVLAVAGREDFSSSRAQAAAQNRPLFIVTDQQTEVLDWLEEGSGVQETEFGELTVITAHPPSSTGSE
jgi:4-amino-4-deoxy-L-arabinose transferase-like glycosyltransferase